MAAASDAFQQLAVRTYLPVGLTFEGQARMAHAEFVSGDYFQLLRLRPNAGRLFGREMDAVGADAEAVLSEKLWRTRFNGDRSIVGKTVPCERKAGDDWWCRACRIRRRHAAHWCRYMATGFDVALFRIA
jgi:hypothetical protein